jgi:transposase
LWCVYFLRRGRDSNRKEVDMGRKSKLTDAEWDALDHLRFGTTDAEVFRNATMILMTAVGRSKTSIAQDLGCSPGTVDNVRKRYRDRGPEGLKRRKPPGPKPRATAGYRTALRRAVQTPPQTLGFGFSVWSAARLGAYLARETGIALTVDRVRSILHEEGYSFQRPKHTMKGKRNEAAYEKSRRQLNRMKKGRLKVIAVLS